MANVAGRNLIFSPLNIQRAIGIPYSTSSSVLTLTSFYQNFQASGQRQMLQAQIDFLKFQRYSDFM